MNWRFEMSKLRLNPRLSSESYKDRFDVLVTQTGLSQGALIEKMLDQYDPETSLTSLETLGLSADERNQVEKAFQESGLEPNEYIKKALLSFSLGGLKKSAYLEDLKDLSY